MAATEYILWNLEQIKAHATASKKKTASRGALNTGHSGQKCNKYGVLKIGYVSWTGYLNQCLLPLAAIPILKLIFEWSYGD